jgi:uroporphyrinogen decarboxylase
MQAGPLISPKMFRARIKPRLQKLIEVIKSKTRAKIWFHSCGSVYYAVRDLIEIGVDILNPVQVAAKDMDTARLKREFGNNIAFWGAIDTQNVLPFGSTQDVETEVKTRLRDLAPGGGYVLASVHNIEADVCGANVWAMTQAAKKFGAYPLRIES